MLLELAEQMAKTAKLISVSRCQLIAEIRGNHYSVNTVIPISACVPC